MTTDKVRQIIRSGKLLRFYKSAEWMRLSEEVKRRDHYECTRCRDVYHRYRPAEIVHHVCHLRDRPDLALSEYYVDGAGVRRRQLVSLCRECHAEVHGQIRRGGKGFKNVERW